MSPGGPRPVCPGCLRAPSAVIARRAGLDPIPSRTDSVVLSRSGRESIPSHVPASIRGRNGRSLCATTPHGVVVPARQWDRRRHGRAVPFLAWVNLRRGEQLGMAASVRVPESNRPGVGLWTLAPPGVPHARYLASSGLQGMPLAHRLSHVWAVGPRWPFLLPPDPLNPGQGWGGHLELIGPVLGTPRTARDPGRIRAADLPGFPRRSAAELQGPPGARVRRRRLAPG